MKRALFILGYLDDEDIDWMLEAGRRVDFPAQSVLINSGVQLADLFILIAGTASVRSASPNGVELAVCHAGELLGELSFLDSRPPRDSVVATSPVTAIAISRDLLRSRLHSNTAFAARFYYSTSILLASRFRQKTGLLTLREGVDELDPLEDSADELDPDLLDHVAIAGHRFNLLSSHFMD